MDEITYIFGAGASCQSMPLVNNFGDRFGVYLSFLRITSFHHKNFIERNESFINSVGAHLSFDTFFKKLFHRNSKKEIVEYKNLLLYYFIFEHLCPVWLYNSKYNPNFPKSVKKFNIDPRYDSLIAGLLKPVQGQCQFYSKINLITWNYDCNILNGVKNFMFHNDSMSNVIRNHRIERNVFSFNEQLKVIYLNGFINHNSIEDFAEVSEESLVNLFGKLIEKWSLGIDLSEEVKDLSFAWENMQPGVSDMPGFINSSCEAVKNSHSIVIIGYSFPLYNRLFDQLILSNENLRGKKIFLRDPRNSEIQEMLFSDFGVPRDISESYDGTPELNSSSSCDSFFVPNQIFTQ